MQRAGCGKIFREKVSAGNRDRPQFQRMLDQIRVGDTIVVLETRSASALHPVHRWRRTGGADTISGVSDQIFEFSQCLNRFSAPLLPNTQVLLLRCQPPIGIGPVLERTRYWFPLLA